MPQVNELDMRSGISIQIETGITKSEAYAIDFLARKSRRDIFCEVGSWTGASAVIISSVAKEFGGHLYCVDHWYGSEGTGLVEEAKSKDIFQIFQSNIRTFGLWDYITPLKMDSVEASKTFSDGSIDFLFIDADHRYLQFMADLETWSLKVKNGGIICGHDCEQKFSSAPPELKERLNRNLDIDFDGNYHAGVIKGLFDYFNDEFRIVPDTRIWFKVIGSE